MFIFSYYKFWKVIRLSVRIQTQGSIAKIQNQNVKPQSWRVKCISSGTRDRPESEHKKHIAKSRMYKQLHTRQARIRMQKSDLQLCTREAQNQNTKNTLWRVECISSCTRDRPESEHKKHITKSQMYKQQARIWMQKSDLQLCTREAQNQSAKP